MATDGEETDGAGREEKAGEEIRRQMRDAAGKNAEETVIVRKKGKVATAAEAEDARGRTAVVIPGESAVEKKAVGRASEDGPGDTPEEKDSGRTEIPEAVTEKTDIVKVTESGRKGALLLHVPGVKRRRNSFI